MTQNRRKQVGHDEVVKAITESILRGRLVPGQRLVEAELCELLHASRGTIRTALRELDRDGLVVLIPNKGARVRVVELAEALQILEVRMAIESLCVGRAAERITGAQTRRMLQLARNLEQRAEEGDAVGYAETTRAVFEHYTAIAELPVAADELNRLRARNARHRFRQTYRPGRAKVSLPYWLAIIDAICARNPEGARKALQRLAKNIEQAMMDMASDDKPFSVIYPGA
nr:GntR family transcriptional regulator [Novosphingobium flavum]